MGFKCQSKMFNQEVRCNGKNECEGEIDEHHCCKSDLNQYLFIHEKHINYLMLFIIT